MDLEILSDASDDEIDDEEVVTETPPPRLTIGDVLGNLPKLKNGKSIYFIGQDSWKSQKNPETSQAQISNSQEILKKIRG